MQEINEEEKENSKESKIEIQSSDHLSLLHKIFYTSLNDSSIFLPIIISTDEIPRLFHYLKNQKDLKEITKEEAATPGSFNTKNKIEILQILLSLFKLNKNLICLFTNKCKSNMTYFFEPIIDLYLEEKMPESDKTCLEQIILYIITNVSIPKFLLEYIYQKLAVYLRYNQNNIPGKLNRDIFMRYLNLLEIFYTNSLDKDIINLYNNQTDDGNENIIDNYFEPEQKKEIKNYIYFNGYNSKMTILLNPSSNNVNCDFPTLELGCSFVFWINLDKEIIDNYYTIMGEKNNNKIISLISFLLGSHRLNLQLINSDNLLLVIDDIESEPINISDTFKYGEWNNICMVIYPKKILVTKIIINGTNVNIKINIPKNYDLNTTERIDNITLFENLIGKVTSVLFCGNTLNNDVIDFFGKSQGFYKIKYLYQFLLSIDSNYYEFSHQYKYYEKFKNITSNKNLSKINIYAKEQNMRNIIGLFCPFTFNIRKNQLDDVFGNYIAVISSQDDGANNYINFSKYIKQIGEINNLLPLLEIMLLSKNKNKFCSSININDNNFEIENLLTEEIFLKYIHIVKKIITGKKHNLYEANHSYFFSHLGLFLEKFPSEIFTTNILNRFYEIGKETFQYTDKNYFSSTFVNMILLNEKIFSKFSEENQLKLWDDINKFFTSDYSQLKDSLNMSKICLLLRFYDKDRYNKYCCKKHADLFRTSTDEEITNIMNPDMNEKVGKLFETIQLFVNKLSNEADTANLFKLLSLDLSPCLQKKIIKTYQLFFKNSKIPEESQNTALDILLKNDFIEIFEYALSISLLDVRLELIELLRIISVNYKPIIDTYIEKNKSVILEYIGEYMLPDNLKVIIENNAKSTSLIEYFNKDIYSNDINSLWNVLNNWITDKTIQTLKEGNQQKIINYLLADPSVMNIFIKFVSKQSPYYIDCFLILLFSLVTNVTIKNIDIFLSNNNFSKWIIEVIYFFNNKQNEKLIEENQKANIELIKLHSIELFKNYIKIKIDDEKKISLLNYILNYSYYLKKKNKNDKEQIKEIINITRILLVAMIESSTWEADILIKTCFEFMFLFKNKEIENNDKEEKEEKEEKKENEENKMNDKNNDKNFNIIRKSLSFSVNVINNNSEKKNKKSNIKDDIYETIEEVEEEKTGKSNNFDEIINSINQKENFDELDIDDDLNSSFDYDNRSSKNKNYESLINAVLIPDILYDNLNMKENLKNDENTESTININKNNNILEEIWEDSKIYDFIIDSYSSNVWGIENLCKMVKIDYDKKAKDIFKDLLREYGENKQYKNILMKTLKKYLNFQNINIFSLNLIILCIAYDTTGDKDEKNYIQNHLEQFLIFCILSSVNITPGEKSHKNLQLKLLDLLGYGLFFLKKRDEVKYSQFIEQIILPIFDDIKSSNTKKGIKGIFGSTKKALYKHTAVYKLFINQDADKEGNNPSDKKLMARTLRAGTFQNKLSFKSKLNKEEKHENLSGKNLIKVSQKSKKEKNKDKNKKNQTINLIFNGDITNIIKHIIDDTIKLIGNERNISKINDPNYIKEFNKYNRTTKDDENLLLKEEIKKINEKILNIVPFLENEIIKYSSTSLIQEKRRRNEYRKIKKIIFSWRGFWSQKELFYDHPENLKLKIKNHFTKEMTKILLTPILDLEYYFPPFNKFDTRKIFNKEDFKYKINLNINDILLSNETENRDKEDKDIENKIDNNEDNNVIKIEEEKRENKTEINSIDYKNKYGFNYLECIYKLTYDGLWEQYKTYSEQKIVLDNTNNIKNQKIYNNLLPELNLNLNSEKNNNSDNNASNTANKEQNKKKKNIKITKITPFKCCLVKSTHHIKGYIMCESKKIKFKYSQKEKENKKLSLAEIIEDPSYDKDMNNCFGSTFRKNLKDNDKVYLNINYDNIQYIFLRKYFYQNTAIEIYTKNHKSYYFNLKANYDLCNFLNHILYYVKSIRDIKTEDHKGKRVLGHEQVFDESNDKKLKSYYVSSKMEEWQNYKISTMEYLMWLNIYSGRSYNDLTQYPVFPWIISNYKTEEIEESNDFRNLSLPIGMMEYNEKSELRKETFIDQYDTVKNDLKDSNHDFNYQEYLKKGEEYFYNYRNKKLKISDRNNSVQIGTLNDNDFSANSLNNPNNLNVNETVNLVEINQLPSYFGSHYSNPTYVSHFLTRIFPYSFVSIEIQGEKFDDPNRIFHSMEKTFESCMTLKDDVRELIPEFYYLPEMLRNNNNLNLTQDLLDLNGERIVINDVELPPWANNSAITFVTEMRNNLEKDKIKINKWIDLIFGTYQKGEKAEEIHNIFQAQTYEKMVKIDKIKDIDTRDAMMRLVEVGVTPIQILDKDSKGKIEKKDVLKHGIYSYAKGVFLDESTKLNKYYITTNNYKLICTRLYENMSLTHNKEYTERIYPSIIAIKCINPKKLKIITNNNCWYTIKISHHDKNIHIEESNINDIENNSSKYAPSYPICLNNTPFIIYNKERNVIKGGFWDTHIEISTLISYEKKEKEKDKDKEEQVSKTIFTPYYGPIVLMKMTKDEKLLFCGTNYGNIIIFDVRGTDLKINKVLYTHSSTITSISINENLNMFASASIDGYINIYTLPSFSIVRSIAISKKAKCGINDYDFKEQKENEFLYADNIFLSSTPLPCFAIYILSKRIFKSYSINGEFISKVEEEIDTGNLKNPIIFQNLNFHDFLIYGTDDGYVKIRSFPGMKLISSIKPFEGQEIKALELSPDNRFCYIWSHKDKIAVIKDSNTSTGFEMKEANGENGDNEQNEEAINEANNSE